MYPPQTLAYVGASLRAEGYQVTAWDSVALGWKTERLLAELRKVPPEQRAVCGVFASYATLETDIVFARTLGAALPDTKIIIFGPVVRYMGEQFVREVAIRAAAGPDVELTVPAAVRTLYGGPLAGAKGLVIKTPAGAMRLPPASPLHDLDSLPRPAWDILPVARYPFLTIQASRGCDDRCAYCPYVAAQGRPRRSRSPEAVVEELAWLQATYDKPRIVFRDPVFAADREWVVQLCRSVEKRKLHVTWECESRPEHFDAPLLRLMHRAGCQMIKIGVETASGVLLERTRRLQEGWTAARYRQQVSQVVAAAEAEGLACRVFVMIGMPGETARDREETRAFLTQLRPVLLSVKPYWVYPGTDLTRDGFVNPTLTPEVMRTIQHDWVTLQRRSASRWQGWLRRLRLRLK